MLVITTTLAGRASASTLATDPGMLMTANGYVVSSETPSTSYGSLACDATGEVGTGQFFRQRVSGPSTLPTNLLVRAPWTLTTQAASAAARATLRAKLLVNSVTVATVTGGPRDISAANGTKYAELLQFSIHPPVGLSGGDLVELRLIPVVTVAGAPGDTFEPTLNHDPQTIDDQLVVENGGT